MSVANFASTTGKGVTGTIEGHDVALGNAKLLNDLLVAADAFEARAESMRADGQTVIFVAVDARSPA